MARKLLSTLLRDGARSHGRCHCGLRYSTAADIDAARRFADREAIEAVLGAPIEGSS